MSNTLVQKFLAFSSHIGHDDNDTEEDRLQKTLLVSISLMMIVACFIWSSIYVLFSELLAAAVPMLYAFFSMFSMIIFNQNKNYNSFRFGQLLLIILLPFILMIALGGFINSSAVVLWSLLGPIGALLFATPSQARYWFVFYLVLIIGSGILERFAPTNNNLSPTVITIFFVMNIGAISSMAFVIIYYFVTQKDIAYKLLDAEQQKSENLLLNVLPEEIAAILKDDQRTIADFFENTSILFADVAGFTPLSATMTPIEVVDMLNEVFTYFDSLAEKYNLEKIKTIGDAYMVAAGVPCPQEDHAHAVARMALEMYQYKPPDGISLDFRIGINSGPVVAGVIGRKKFIYDLWGDAVNTASRMESHGTVGKIQITKETYELIKDDFVCEPQGKIMVKGKGEMDVWHLVAEK